MGKTEDNKIVISGVFKLHTTLGIPLEISLPILSDHNFIPDWLDICHEAFKIGMSWNRLRSVLYVSISEAYGPKFRDEVITILDKIFNLGFDKVLFTHKGKENESNVK